jgi:hypothetical protein
MSTIASAQRARTAALIAAALAALGCSESGSLTAPHVTPAASVAAPSIAGAHKPNLSGYALASGRADTLTARTDK